MNNTHSQVPSQENSRQGPVLDQAVARRILLIQSGVALIVALGFLVFKGYWSGLSALYGAATSIVVALLLSRGVKKAGAMALQNPGGSMASLYLGAVQRFLVVVGLLAVGLGLLKFEPLPIVSGFIIAQLSYALSSKRS